MSIFVNMIKGIVLFFCSSSIHLLPTECAGASLLPLLHLLPIIACTINGPAPNSQLANLRRAPLLNFGQIWTDWLVRPWQCRCEADWLLSKRMRFSTFSEPSCQLAPPAFSAQSRKKLPFSPLSASFISFDIFQLFAVSFFFCEKGWIKLKIKS